MLDEQRSRLQDHLRWRMPSLRILIHLVDVYRPLSISSRRTARGTSLLLLSHKLVLLPCYTLLSVRHYHPPKSPRLITHEKSLRRITHRLLLALLPYCTRPSVRRYRPPMLSRLIISLLRLRLRRLLHHSSPVHQEALLVLSDND